MAYKPKDWLGPFLEDEVSKATAWYKRISTHAHIKKDPGSRFEDDASNLRSKVPPGGFEEGDSVQIAKILSAGDALITVTDGFTSVRAHLSTDAVATLESEIGDKIDADMKGDIFSIRTCTVVSTPYGPTDGHVQLVIEELDYHYHLRKVAGNPVSVGERPEIVRLMGDIMRLRHPEPAEEPAVREQTPRLNGQQPSSRRSEQRFETQAEPQSPASQANQFLTSSPLVSQPPVMNPRKMASRSRKTAPNMDRDGIEVVAGVNLAKPTALNPVRPAYSNPNLPHAKPRTISNNSAHLLSVLGKRKVSSDGPSIPRRPENDDPKVASSTNAKDAPLPLVPAAFQSAESQLLASQPKEAATPASHVRMHPPVISSAKSIERRLPKAHWHRQIPKEQRSLLDSPTSWLPSLPGRQFPHPNVPIETLKQWNHQAQTRPESVLLSQARSAQSQSFDQGQKAGLGPEESSDSDSASEPETQIEWSSSPPRPAAQATSAIVSPAVQKRMQVRSSIQSSPPSSSLPERLSSRASPSSRPSSAGRHPDLPPDSSWEKPVAPRALGGAAAKRLAREEAVGNSMAGPAARSPRALSYGPLASHREGADRVSEVQMIQSPKGLFATRAQPSPVNRQGRLIKPGSELHSPARSTAPFGTDGAMSPSQERPARTSSRDRTGPIHVANNAGQTSAEVEILHVSQSPAQSRTLQKAPPPSSSATAVIRGTQVVKDSDADLVEIDPPSLLDPTLEHQKRRSEYFKGEQRRKWIKANCTPNGTRQHYKLGLLYNAYKKDYPKDQLRLSELREAYEDIFPNAVEDASEGDPRGSARRNIGSTQAANVVSSAEQLRPTLADVDWSDDATPSRAPVAPRPQQKPELEQQPPALTDVRRMLSFDPRAKPQNANLGKSATPSTRDADVAKPRVTTTANALGDPQGKAPERVNTDGRTATGTAAPAKSTTSKPAVVKPQAQHRAKASPAGSGSAAPSKAKGLPDHHAWFVKCIERDQQRLAEEESAASKQSQRRDDGREAFAEFAQAWRNARPGGAFARDRSERERTGRQRARLDVLGWEL